MYFNIKENSISEKNFQKFIFNYYWHVNMISGIFKLGNCGYNKRNTEPDSQSVRNIEDKHTLFREPQNFCLKNLEKNIVDQVNIKCLKNKFDLLQPLV